MPTVMTLLKKMMTTLGLVAEEPHGKPGARAYAVGDVHGCVPQLDDLLAQIEADHRARGPKPCHLVFLGDLVDRGPESRAVVERLIAFRPAGITPVFLMGNHEEFLLRALDGDPGTLHHWLQVGGAECAASYGLQPNQLLAMEEDAATALLRGAVPATHRQFLASFHDTFRFGDYLFVHAGIRPGVSLERQSSADLRWIREPFLSDRAAHGFVVVHGHTIGEEVVEKRNRIGIDTGAYRGGPLTAVAIEGTERRFLQALPRAG